MRIHFVTSSLILGCALFIGCARPATSTLTENAKAMRIALEAGVEAGGAGAAAELPDPEGWATLTGTFRLNGASPSRSPLNVTKDQEICAPGGQQVLDEVVLVGPAGGLKNVLIYVSSSLPTDDPNWEHEDYQANKFAEVEFDQKNCVFLTHVAAYRSTQTVKVLNSDPVGHNTNLDSKRGSASGNFNVPSNGFEIYNPKAPSPAPFTVSCNIHPWMNAWMMICDHPYFAVTDAEGRFEIRNVPASVELEFRAWQEKPRFLQEVTVNDQAQKWSKGRFKLTLEPDETRELNVTIDAAVFQ